MLKKRSGFTVIEILITTIIVAILSIAAIYGYQMYVEEARTSEIIPIVKSIFNAQRDYYDEHGDWAKSIFDLNVEIDGGRKFTSFDFSGGMEGVNYIVTKHFAYGSWIYNRNGYSEPQINVIRYGRGVLYTPFYSVSFRENEQQKVRWTGLSLPGVEADFGFKIKERVLYKIIKRLTGQDISV